ncbi:chitobiase/beta-hexosaminidase C-terminal domain-containing protein [Tepidanaerobacter syntrophicus]|uniref:chitobiase/beta-hexosaminidase C-terminal domain-containing protein n=1 Tax=Tepidanaerobacter syntrophicus TaxID=224999 RepID=UPI001BD1E982|nr:chitobiase/beta-hexosaminidase C-terminal domain-containing protein [Tepidanaerobacter syntrophicus]
MPKKIISLLVALAMLVSLLPGMPVIGYAADEETGNETEIISPGAPEEQPNEGQEEGTSADGAEIEEEQGTPPEETPSEEGTDTEEMPPEEEPPEEMPSEEMPPEEEPDAEEIQEGSDTEDGTPGENPEDLEPEEEVLPEAEEEQPQAEEEVLPLLIEEEPKPEPEFIYAWIMQWDGTYPTEGDTSFYVEAKGHNLEELEAVVCISDSSGYTYVASQMGKFLLGKTIEGYEWYIYKMEMDSGETLEDTTYYIRLWDEQTDTYYDAEQYGNFNPLSSDPSHIHPYLRKTGGPVEILSSAASVPFELIASDFATGLSESDFEIEVIHTDSMDWDGPEEGTVVKVGEMTDFDVTLAENCSYIIKGNAVLNENLEAGQKLYAAVTAPTRAGDRTAYTDMQPISVLSDDSASIGQFNILNSLPCRNMQEGHFEGGSDYMPADGTTTFAIGNDENKLYFKITGTKLSDASKLTFTVNDTAVQTQNVSMSGPDYGIYTITGEIAVGSSQAGDLKIFYNGQELYQTSFTRVTESEAKGATQFIPMYDKNDIESSMPIMLAGSSFYLDLGYPLNITPDASKFTAVLTKYGNDGITTDVAADVDKGRLTLKIAVPQKLVDMYEFRVFYDGEPLNIVGYNYNGSTENFEFDSYESQVNIYFGKEGKMPYIYMTKETSSGLTVYGDGFSSDKNYTAHFIQRGTESINPPEEERDVDYRSETELVVAKDELKSLSPGWYSIYLTAAAEEGEELINGVVDATLLLAESEALKRPTARITTGDYTTERTISLSVSFGDYKRVKIAESVEGLEGAEWQSTPPTSYTLSETYGLKTLYFLFEADDGSTITLTATINYRPSSLAPMLEFGIAGVEISEAGVILDKGVSYTLYFKHIEPNLVGTVVFEDENGNILQSETLYRTSGHVGEWVYSKSIKTVDSLANAKRIVFSAKTKTTPEISTESIAIPVAIRDQASIGDAQTKFDVVYFGYGSSGQYISKNGNVTYSLSGTANFEAKAVVKYIDFNNSEAEKEYTLPETGNSTGIYKLKSTLPEDAAKIKSVQYIIEDPLRPDINKFSDEKTYEIPITSSVSFKDLDNSDGKYNSVYLTLISSQPWDYRNVSIRDNINEINFENLIPGVSYKYDITGTRNMTFASGNIDTQPGQESVVSLSGENIKVPATITFDSGDAELSPNSYIYYTFVSGEHTNSSYAAFGTTQENFYVGQEIKYTVNLSSTDLRKYKAIEQKTFKIENRSQNITIPLEELSTIKISGKVTDKKISGRPIEGVSVTAIQSVHNGYLRFNHSTSAVTDSEGKFELDLYPNDLTRINFGCSGYENLTMEDFEPSSEAPDIAAELTYATKNTVRITLKVLPLVAEGETPDLSEASVADVNQIYLWSASGISGGVQYNPYYSKITFSGEDNAEKEVSFTFNSYKLDLVQPTITTKLDAYGNGSIEVLARQNGMIAANIPTSGENPPLGYMIVFDQNGNRCGNVITGAGYLSTAGLNLKNGTYTVVALKGYNLTKLSNFWTLSRLKAALPAEDTFYVEKTVNVRNGILTDLGDVEIPEIVTNELLGGFNVRFETEYVPSTNEAKVVARIEALSSSREKNLLIYYIAAQSTTSAVKDNSAFIDGKKMNYYNYYWPGSTDKKILDHLLQFSVTPSENQQIVTADIEISYILNDQLFTEKFSQTIPVDRVTLETKEQIEQGEKARSLSVSGTAPAGANVEIYDGPELVGSVIADAKNHYTSIISLTHPDEPGVHLLTAKAEYNEKMVTSVETPVEVLSKTMSAYASNIEFLHYPHSMWNDYNLKTNFLLDDPQNPNYSPNRFYNPNMKTKITFRINNLLQNQIDEAMVVTSYLGVESVHKAKWKNDVENEDSVYSEWEVDEALGLIDNVYVQFTLKDVDELSMITGYQVPDFNEAVSAMPDPAEVLPEIRDNAANADIQIDPTSYNGSIPVDGGGSLNFNIAFSENVEVTPEQLEAQGFRRFNTLQGSYWVKESVVTTDGAEPGTVDSQMRRQMYFDENLTRILKADQYAVNNQPKALKTSSQTAGATDTALSAIDITGNLQNTGEIVYEKLKGAPAELGRYGTAMNVVGGAGLAVNILRGRTTKDAQALYDVVNLVRDTKKQNALCQEIRDYSDLTVSHYCISNTFNSVGYVAGYIGPVGKGLSIITSLGGSWYNSSTSQELDAMWDSIMRSIMIELKLQDYKPTRKEKQEKTKWLLDPSGYVFEGIDSNRVEGVEASIYGSDSKDGSYNFWQEASESNQENPQLTNYDGRYGWDVPEGWWKVQFSDEQEKYLPSETKPMEVPPIHDKVNIGLLATEKPNVIGAALTPKGLEIEFDKFMQAESIYEEDMGIINAEVYDGSGNLVPIEKIDFLIMAENTAYKEDMDYQRDIIYSDNFVKRICLVADETKYPGGFHAYKENGETQETYIAEVSQNVKSYAGVKMTADYITEALTLKERTTAAIPTADIADGSYAEPIYVKLSSETPGATIYYTTDGSNPTTLSRVYKEVVNTEEGKSGLPIEKTCVLKFFASKAGMDDSDIATASYTIGEAGQNITAAPTASIPSGTYSGTQHVTLSCRTPGATIYYTLDGTRPSISSNIYSGPIEIAKATTIKAIAVKEGYADSAVATFVYVIKESAGGGENGGGTGGTGGTGGGSTTKKTTSESEPTVTVEKSDGISIVKAVIETTVSDGKATANITADIMEALIEKAVKEGAGAVIQLNIQTGDGVSRIAADIPAESLETAAAKGISVEFLSPLASILFDEKALDEIAKASPSENVSITISSLSPIISDDLRIGGRPTYELTVKAGSKTISDFGDGIATVRIPYKLQSGENRNAIVVYYLGDEENLRLIRGRYDAKTISVVFKTNHFSKFIIGYNLVTFKDVPASAWYKDAVDFIAARGITTGTAEGIFSPQEQLTRSQYLVMLMRAYGIEPDAQPKDNFLDAGSTYYTGYLAAAKRLNITKGIGSNLFAPERPITRQEMFTLLYNTLKELGELPVGTTGTTLESFRDADKVAPWAKEAMEYLAKTGMVRGSDGLLTPESIATRAEMAQVLYNLL